MSERDDGSADGSLTNGDGSYAVEIVGFRRRAVSSLTAEHGSRHSYVTRWRLAGHSSSVEQPLVTLLGMRSTIDAPPYSDMPAFNRTLLFDAACCIERADALAVMEAALVLHQQLGNQSPTYYKIQHQ